MVRRELTEPNAALAGAIPDISFARFRASMVTFNEERAPFRPFGLGRLETVSMVGTRDSGEISVWRVQAARKEPNANRNTSVILYFAITGAAARKRNRVQELGW